MNYIICSSSAATDAKKFYEEACVIEGYHASLEAYIKENLFINQDSFLYEHICQESGSFYIWGKQCKGLVQPHRSKRNSFYLKRIQMIKQEDFYRKLSYLYQMAGKWCVISEGADIYMVEKQTEDIQQVDTERLVETMDIRYGLRRFEDEWNQEDLYNKILTEAAVRKENESVTKVERIEVKKTNCSIYINHWKECFETEQFVDYCGNGLSLRLGQPGEVQPDSRELIFKELDTKTLNLLLWISKQGSYGTVRMIDLGKKTRLKRQQKAIEKLYNEKTVNPELKNLLMNEIRYVENDISMLSIDELKDYLNRFGDNVMQKQAFLGAIGSSDIFLIQGPPGTGKTTVISELVNYIAASGQKVLLSSETHVAVDNVLERMDQKDNVFPIRLGKEENITQNNHKYLLEHRVQALLDKIEKQAHELVAQYDDFDHAKERIRKKLDGRLAEYNIQINNLKETLQLTTFTSHDLKRVLSYQDKVSECADIYENLKQADEDVAEEQKQLERITLDIHSVRTRIALCKENAMRYGTAADLLSDTYKVEEQNSRQKLDDLMKKYQEVKRNSSVDKQRHWNQHFLQKCDELDRDKLFLNRKRKDKKISLREYIYQIQNGVRELLYLDKKRKEGLDQLESDYENEVSKLEHQKELLDKTKELRKEWALALSSEETTAYFQDLYIDMANIICATCSGIASAPSQIFQEVVYDYVIIDEAAKCNTLDLLIPLTMGKKIILVGDHKQLAPMIEEYEGKIALDEEVIRSIKENTLFKRLYEERVSDSCKCMLNTQYRMDEMICRFISDTFYEGRLKNGCGVRTHGIREFTNSMMWLDCNNSAEEKVHHSYLNKVEAELVIHMLDFLDRHLTQRKTVGIISPYKKQVEYIENLLQQRNYQYLEIENSTVDAFQGKEKQIVVFNIVRSKHISGFLRDRNRINVAVSRAQELFVAIGSKDFVKQINSGVLSELYHYLERMESVYNANLCDQ